jgi:DNA-directed RNA polymerase subunit RPC12/RpoP
MPPCPQCGSNAGVARCAQGVSEHPEESPAYVCEYCGSTFDAPPQPPVEAQVKATAGIQLHHAGYARAEALIGRGNLTDAAWSYTAEDRRAANPDDFLATDDLAGIDTEAHWKYPVIKRGEVYRRGVAAAEGRASREGAAEIAEAAGRLMQAIRAADAAEAKVAEIERAASGAFVRPETIRAAIRKAVEDGRAELPMMIRAELKEAFARATGKV